MRFAWPIRSGRRLQIQYEIRLQAARSSIPIDQLALHFHDTSGSALANVEKALDLDVRTFDSAAGGLGGCPFAPGAPGNLGTEQLIGRWKRSDFAPA